MGSRERWVEAAMGAATLAAAVAMALTVHADRHLNIGAGALFIAAFALAPGADYTRVYLAGQINMTAKAIADLLYSRGPLKTQQIRQGLRLHKRFLAHDVPGALAQVERALLIVAGGPELAASWEAPAPVLAAEEAAPPTSPRSRWSRQIAHDLDLRVWELTARWAPPETLAAADRLREHPTVAQATLTATARALVPAASDVAIRDWFGWSTLPPPAAEVGG
jgi:hypothetical protein